MLIQNSIDSIHMSFLIAMQVVREWLLNGR